MKSISSSIADILGTQGIIQREDIDKCRYGLEIFLSSMLEITSILIISAFVGNFLETILLFTTFIPLRIYAGGYHADTKLKCYLVSLAVYVGFTVIMRLLPQEVYLIINIVSTVFSLLVVFIAAPVIHHNKSVNEIERMYYKKISRGICIGETVLIILLTTTMPTSKLVSSLACGQVAVTVAMVVAIIKEKLNDNK